MGNCCEHQEANKNATLSWTRMPTLNELAPRSSHGVSVIDNNIVVFGGENQARTPIDSVLHVYTRIPCATNSDVEGQWKPVIKNSLLAPSHRVAHSQAVVNNKLYVFGGRQGIGMDEAPLNDLWCFDWTDKTWSEINHEGDVPEARSFHQMVAGKGANSQKLYVFGGCAKVGRLSDLHEYDILTQNWKKLATSPDIRGRGGACFQSSGEDLYVIAGFAGEETNDVHKFSNGAWTQLADFPAEIAPRSVAAACTIPSLDMICIFGGELGPSARGHEGAGDFSSDVICLPTSGNQIVNRPRQASAGPSARGWLNSALLCEGTENGRRYAEIVIFGGLSGNDEEPVRNNDMWKLRIE